MNIFSLLLGGVEVFNNWREGKKQEALKELEIKQASQRSMQELRLTQAKADIDADHARILQMDKSWKDEWWTAIWSLPLVGIFLSPFIDLLLLQEYTVGALGNASSLALSNLENAPMWYVVGLIIQMCLSFGYRKGIDTILENFKRR
ncbi:hypothetical protein [Pseudoalteromonas phage J2-1_QLiu-2017]|nr:hypothetical protein [Pseudoalteromonas phage J2-1_QLiu-2017]